MTQRYLEDFASELFGVICRLLAQNVGLLAVIVGPSLSLLARNVSRKPHLFAGSEVAVCRPLQLGFETCFEVHAFLKAHEVPFYTLDDLNHDRETLRQLGV